MTTAVAWFKVACDIFANVKVRRAGPIGALVFLFVLARNAARDALGWIPAEELEPWYVADTLRLDEAQARDGIDRAIAAKLIAINGDRVEIVGWADEWAKRPLTEAERKRLQRATAKAQQSADVRTDVTPQRDSPDCPARRGDLGERDLGEEREESRPRKRGRARARRVPSDWQPRLEDATLAPPQLERELAKFRDHEFATAKSDWDATWRNWQRNVKPNHGPDVRFGRAEPMHPSAYPDGDLEI